MKSLKVGDKIDANTGRGWSPAEIIKIKQNKDKAKVKVHYIGYDAKYDAYLRMHHSKIRPFGSVNSKLRSAKNAILCILKQLTKYDRLSIVTFESDAEILQYMEFVSDLYRKEVKHIVNEIIAGGGTNFDKGCLTKSNCEKVDFFKDFVTW